MKKFTAIILFFFFKAILCFGQIETPDTSKLNYNQFFSFCLDGNIPDAMAMIKANKSDKTEKEIHFIDNFTNTFGYENDRSDYLINHSSQIDDLLKVFHNYWREALLHPEINYDDVFTAYFSSFLSKELFGKNDNVIQKDSLDFYFNKYIKSKNLYATNGAGKTGKLYDLLVWRAEKDTTYTFKLGKETTTSRVIFMQDFVTLGWEEYATLGRSFPGGWATKDALYCVEQAYDLNSENFLVSYLAHEGFHFKDYQRFPKLKSADLEYRAKLIELSLANTTLFDLINFFISNSNFKSENGHSVANYCVIRDLSKSLFKNEFEKDINKWKEVSVQKINESALRILNENTKILQTSANTVEEYIKYEKVKGEK